MSQTKNQTPGERAERVWNNAKLQEREFSVSSDRGEAYFEISDGSTMTLRFERLVIGTNSNFAFPFYMEVEGGRLGLTATQARRVLVDFAHLSGMNKEG